MITWPAKDPAEILVATFDFSEDFAVGETIAAATVTCTVLSGVDEAPVAVVDSALPAIDGGSVRQRLTGGVAGVSYRLRCTVELTPSGRVLVLAATLPVRTA